MAEGLFIEARLSTDWGGIGGLYRGQRGQRGGR